MMNGADIIFYLIAILMLVTAILAVTTRKIFRGAIWLLLSLVGVASLYFWMHMEFIAAVQIVVYVGGIVVLIIFSVFLTQHSGKDMVMPSVKRIVFSLLSVVLGFLLCSSVIYEYGFPQIGPDHFEVTMATIGTQMLSTDAHGFALPLELVSILLLAAMIGCIVIAMKSKEVKTPDELGSAKSEDLLNNHLPVN
jgi:NADH-quinone oxidoreductase subunit J